MNSTTSTRQASDRKDVRSWCEECGAQVAMLTAFEAAVKVRVSSYTIYRWAEVGTIHYSTTPKGVLLVCPNSLPQPRSPKSQATHQ